MTWHESQLSDQAYNKLRFIAGLRSLISSLKFRLFRSEKQSNDNRTRKEPARGGGGVVFEQTITHKLASPLPYAISGICSSDHKNHGPQPQCL